MTFEQFMREHQKTLWGALRTAVRNREKALAMTAMMLPSDRYPQKSLDLLAQTYQDSITRAKAALADLEQHFLPPLTAAEGDEMLRNFETAFGNAPEQGGPEWD